MPIRPKRSERIGINLTPVQHQKLQLAAKTAKRTPATYAYKVLCQALDGDGAATVVEDLVTPPWVNQLAELYGILDALTRQLANQTDRHEAGQEQAKIESLLAEVKGQVEDIQKMLLSLSEVGVGH